MQDSCFEVHPKVPIQLHRYQVSQDHSELFLQTRPSQCVLESRLGSEYTPKISTGSISSDVSSNALRFAALHLQHFPI